MSNEQSITISSDKDRLPNQTLDLLIAEDIHDDAICATGGCIVLKEVVFPDSETSEEKSPEFLSEASLQAQNIYWIQQQKPEPRPRNPLNCSGMAKLWKGCQRCKWYGAIGSPLFIKRKEAAQFYGLGFHRPITRGKATHHEPDPDDLVKYYSSQYEWVTIEGTTSTYFFNGKYWEPVHKSRILQFAQLNFRNPDGSPTKTYWYDEFYKKVLNYRIVKPEWFNTRQIGLVNFQNGVLDIKEGKLIDHSTQYSFRYCLPFNYDPKAKAPMFEKSLYDWMLGRPSLIELVKQYSGYAVCGGGTFEHQKAALLYGPTAANGKTTLANIIEMVAGPENCSNIPLHSMSDLNVRLQLDGKLVNFSRETNPDSIEKSETFKSMMSGEPILVHRLYGGKYTIQSTAKHFILSNDMLWSHDKSDGLTRRMLPIPFDAKFDENNRDPYLLDKLKEERAGIFNLLLEAYQRLQSKGQFIESDDSVELLDEMKEANDPLRQWLIECIEINVESKDEKHFVELIDLYGNYKLWCLSSGYKPIGKSTFQRRFSAMNPRLLYNKGSNMPHLGKRAFGFWGITKLHGAVEQGDNKQRDWQWGKT